VPKVFSKTWVCHVPDRHPEFFDEFFAAAVAVVALDRAWSSGAPDVRVGRQRDTLVSAHFTAGRARQN
jgi:hypothetical protein